MSSTETATPEPTPPPERPAEHVIEAIARVMRDLPPIGKDGQMKEQGGYRYRGIEQITAAAQKLCARHGVVFAPVGIEKETSEKFSLGASGSSTGWTDTHLTVSYKVFGPGGIEDFILVEVPGIGRDNADKGTNKAMTQAFKYALMQVFMVSDPQDDADGTTHAITGEDPQRAITDDEAATLQGLIDSIDPTDRAAVGKAWKAAKLLPLTPKKAGDARLPAADVPRVMEMLAPYLATEPGSHADPDPCPVEGCAGDILHDGPHADANGVIVTAPGAELAE